MSKTTFSQKIGLFLFALSVTLLILEGVLRLGGWIFLLKQEAINRSHVSTGGEYRILCLGESTTALGGDDAYPRQLERMLNTRQDKMKFKVINKGVPATTTDQILARVESYIAEYEPRMIIAMMGINDPESQTLWTWRDQLSRYSKAFKLFDMLVRHLTAKASEPSTYFVDRQIAKLDAQAAQNPALRLSIELAKANFYRSANRPREEEQALLKALSLDHENAQAWFLMGIHYDRQAEYQKALEAYHQADKKADPEMKLKILERIAQNQKFLGNPISAIQIYKAILKQWPQHQEVNGALADILLEQKKYQDAAEYFSKQLTIDPNKSDVYDKLAHCYRQLGQNDKAQEILARASGGAGENQGETKAKLGMNYNASTKDNYLKLIKIAQEHHIPVLVVSYPYRSVEALQATLSSAAGVVFVDNHAVFAEALASSSYDEIFSDRFAGDFGHCTAKGNAVLAKNIADHVLKVIQP